MTRLTRPMRNALEDAVRQELRRVHDTPGPAAWPAHPSTLAALVRHELLTRSTRRSKRGHQLDAWTITDAGRAALQPRDIFRRQPDLYLTHAVPETTTGGHGEFTTDPRRALCREGDAAVIDPDTLDDAWSQVSTERRHAAQDRRARARRAARNIRSAA
jgi:hypothetical protein